MICNTLFAAEESPYAEGFPTPKRSPSAPKISLTRNAQGLLVRSEESYQESAAHVQEYLTSKYIPAMRRFYPKYYTTPIKRAPLPAIDGLSVHENVIYARWGDRAMVLDLYIPSKHKKPLPLVMFIHGGGWQHGSHRDYRSAAMAFAKRGFATAAVEYRLSGEAMFPAAIYDVKAATRWLRANSKKYNLDPKRFGITGGSAGANIAALSAVTFGDSRFEGPANHLNQSSEIQCVVPMYNGLRKSAEHWTRSKLGSPLRNETSPHFHIANGSHLPPILLLKEEKNRKIRRGKADTMDIIKKAGKEHLAEQKFINAPHAFIHFSPHQALALDQLERFFSKHLGQPREKAP